MPAPVILAYAGRFKLWDRPAAYPQVDLVNGTPEGPVFDLDVNSEDGGGMYIKAVHVGEMATTLGYMSPEEANELRAELARLQNQVDNLPNAVEELKDGIDSLVRNFYAGLDYRPDLPVDESEDNGSNDGLSTEISGNSESDGLESFGLSGVERPNGIPSDSGDGITLTKPGS